MKFELLPNEVLIECFEYLNGLDIFYAFNQLNSRFYHLIRNIPLYIDFQNIRRRIFNEFCQEILCDSKLQNQIYSLKLSNKYTYGQIQLFLSFFSLEQFIQLRSLTLIDIEIDNIKQLDSVLPALSQLTHFHLIYSSKNETIELVSKLPLSKLTRLSILSLSPIDEIIPLKNLTISRSSLKELCQLIQYMPMLQYLNVLHAHKTYFCEVHDSICSKYYNAIHLKYLIITNLQCEFDEFKSFVKHTSMIKSLTISSNYNQTMIDASHWQQLITSSLPYLDSFKFNFQVHHPQDNGNSVIEKFKEFQTKFWYEEHHWNTEYIISPNLSCIYTIPYLIDSNQIPLNSNRYYHQSINNLNTFDNVTILSLSKTQINECEYYFRNITTLEITSLPIISNENDVQKIIQSLKKIVNLSQIKYLRISFCFSTEVLPLLLEIIKEAIHLSSLGIFSTVFELLLNNDELCNYLRMMIKKLQFIDKDPSLAHGFYITKPFREISHFINSLCQIFSNLECLSDGIYTMENILFLLQRLTKLSTIEGRFHYTNDKQYHEFKDHILKLNGRVYENIEYSKEGYAGTFGIWIDENRMK